MGFFEQSAVDPAVLPGKAEGEKRRAEEALFNELHSALYRLKPLSRTIVLLRFRCGMKQADAARELGISLRKLQRIERGSMTLLRGLLSD
jgi:DNA-directed RNA polymerase specialized sigma24 family protein